MLTRYFGNSYYWMSSSPREAVLEGIPRLGEPVVRVALKGNSGNTNCCKTLQNGSC